MLPCGNNFLRSGDNIDHPVKLSFCMLLNLDHSDNCSSGEFSCGTEPDGLLDAGLIGNLQGVRGASSSLHAAGVWRQSRSGPSGFNLQRNVPVLLARINVALVFQRAKRNDDALAGLGRFDDRVNVAAFGGDKWIGESLAELCNFFLA